MKIAPNDRVIRDGDFGTVVYVYVNTAYADVKWDGFVGVVTVLSETLFIISAPQDVLWI